MAYNKAVERKLRELLKMYWILAGIVFVLIIGINIYFILRRPVDLQKDVHEKLIPLPAEIQFETIDRILQYEENLPLKIDAFEDLVDTAERR